MVLVPGQVSSLSLPLPCHLAPIQGSCPEPHPLPSAFLWHPSPPSLACGTQGTLGIVSLILQAVKVLRTAEFVPYVVFIEAPDFDTLRAMNRAALESGVSTKQLTVSTLGCSVGTLMALEPGQSWCQEGAHCPLQGQDTCTSCSGNMQWHG